MEKISAIDLDEALKHTATRLGISVDTLLELIYSARDDIYTPDDHKSWLKAMEEYRNGETMSLDDYMNKSETHV